MRCPKHPSAHLLPGRTICFICQDWSNGSAFVESDRRKFSYEQSAQHIEPGVKGIRTKGAYQRLLKRHGRTDDLTNREIASRVMDTGFRKSIQHKAVKQVVHTMFSTRRG